MGVFGDMVNEVMGSRKKRKVQTRGDAVPPAPARFNIVRVIRPTTKNAATADASGAAGGAIAQDRDARDEEETREANDQTQGYVNISRETLHFQTQVVDEYLAEAQSYDPTQYVIHNDYDESIGGR
jgi:hypothetical protein